MQCASRPAYGGVVGKLIARCSCMHSSWQLVFLPLHHMLTYLHIAQPIFAQFRCFFTTLYTIFKLWREQSKQLGKILGEELLRIVSLQYITLFTCKYLYWLPVGLVINTCTCLYTLFVFLEGRKMNPGTKQPHIPIPASMPRKGAGGGGRKGGGGGGQGGRGGGKYLCVSFYASWPKLYVFWIFQP